MIDEHRDPELESVRAEWEAPAPSAGFHSRVLSAFEEEFAQAPWWRRRWVLAAGLVAGAAMAVVLLRPARDTHYEPVRQPHFMVVSAGEHP